LIPLQITWRDVPQSDAIEATIRARADKLDQFYERFLSCKVTVGKSNRCQYKGNLYQIHLDIALPGKEIAVTREPGDKPSHEDMYVTIHDAFDAARRQIQDHVSLLQDQMKHHTKRSRNEPDWPDLD